MPTRGFHRVIGIAVLFAFALFIFFPSSKRKRVPATVQPDPATFLQTPNGPRFDWAARKEHFPVKSFLPMPTGRPAAIPQIQFEFKEESAERKKVIASRRDAVKASFVRSWDGYKSKAWLKDELAPLSGTSKGQWGGWGATLVDSLDTIWIMGKEEDFEEAVNAVKGIDFYAPGNNKLSTFETTIRYMGGLLAAYDLSNGKHPILLEKALQLGNLLYAAFDTPNRMPLTIWYWKSAIKDEPQHLNRGVVAAELGSLSLEFTRLSQLTGDPKFFDAIQRISDKFEIAQPLTKLPGMWPSSLDPTQDSFGGSNLFTVGSMEDSLYEYLPKLYMLLGGLEKQPREMYEKFIKVAKKHVFFRPMLPDLEDILISGNIQIVSGAITLDSQGSHLACFVGGMMAIASRIFDLPDDLPIARKLTEGCIWAYEAMPSGIMPESFHAYPCPSPTTCVWNAKIADSVPGFPGFANLGDTRYMLRPEAIESIFILYRVTGDERLRDQAWKMFEAIEKHTKAEFGNAALKDVTNSKPEKVDSMETFWTAETLKYFYLIFSPPDLISLDEYVFNTEAHPFKRPK